MYDLGYNPLVMITVASTASPDTITFFELLITIMEMIGDPISLFLFVLEPLSEDLEEVRIYLQDLVYNRQMEQAYLLLKMFRR